MNNIFLLNLRISGIKNIEKPVDIPFYKKTIKDDFDPEQYWVKGIYGENGSGKTAIMTAVKILTNILLTKNYLNDSMNQKLLFENINKKTGNCLIEVVFRMESSPQPYIYRYQIGLEIEKDGRVSMVLESLEKKNGKYSQNPFTPVFKVEQGELLHFVGGKVFENCREKTRNLLKQRSFVSFTETVREYGDPATLPDLFHLYGVLTFAANVYVQIDEEDDHSHYVYRNMLSAGNRETLQEASDLNMHPWASAYRPEKGEILVFKPMMDRCLKKTAQLASFIRIFKHDLVDIELDKKDFGNYYVCRRVMVYGDYQLDEEYESRGIRKLMGLFEMLDAACNGSIVFIDELDSNINDIYLDKLIEYIACYGKGQLCFTAHNLSPMSVLREHKCSITFISSVNTVQTWTSNGNLNPEHAYRNGFIEDSPFNVVASDFLGILGGTDE